jgi:hypothetical protein
MNILVKIATCAIVALVSWGLWVAEVRWIKGWTGLAWLSGFNWSSLPICGLIAGACSYLLAPHIRRTARFNFILLAFSLTGAAFFVARFGLMEWLSTWNVRGFAIGAAGSIVVAGLAVSIGLAALANKWLAPMHPWTAALVAGALMAVLPLSFATVTIFPAFNGSTDGIHSIKMGYPVFWTSLLVPLALQLGRKKTSPSAFPG